MLKILTFTRDNAVALAALFVALGGTSYAALSLPAGSVGTTQLRNGAVTNRKLARHAVASANLDPKSIAGHIADWVQIRADGHVISSGPRASVTVRDSTRGLFEVSWHRSIPSRCMAIASPANVPAAVGQTTANTLGPDGVGRNAFVLVQTFNAGGDNVPENVNVMVICP